MKWDGEDGTEGAAAFIDWSWQQPVWRYRFCLIHEPVTSGTRFSWKYNRSSDERACERQQQGCQRCRDGLPCSAAPLTAGVHPRPLTPFKRTHLTFFFFFSFLLLFPSLPPTLVIVCFSFAAWCVLTGLIDSRNNGCRFHPLRCCV